MSDLEWTTSSVSGGSECVEVTTVAGLVMVRDSNDPTGPTVAFTLAEWNAFLAGVRRGEFDLDRLGKRIV